MRKAAKHSAAQPIVPSEVVPPPADSDSSHPVTFDLLTGALVKSVAMFVSVAAGPSWADAAAWRRFCSCFKGPPTIFVPP